MYHLWFSSTSTSLVITAAVFWGRGRGRGERKQTPDVALTITIDLWKMRGAIQSLSLTTSTFFLPRGKRSQNMLESKKKINTAPLLPEKLELQTAGWQDLDMSQSCFFIWLNFVSDWTLSAVWREWRETSPTFPVDRTGVAGKKGAPWAMRESVSFAGPAPLEDNIVGRNPERHYADCWKVIACLRGACTLYTSRQCGCRG